MKKIALITIILITGLFTTSCNIGKLDARIYGVAVNMSVGDGDLEQLVINCPEYGYMFIPDTDHIYGQFASEYTPNYVIEEGDLLEIFYSRAGDVEILESYPGQFGKEPDSIIVAKQNVFLGDRVDDEWLFEFSLEAISYDSEFDVDEMEAGDTIYIYYSTIVNKIPDQAALFTTTIELLSEEKMSFNIPHEFITDFLEHFSENNVFLYSTEPLLD